jgi:Ca2+-binding RTX toxin-like protein
MVQMAQRIQDGNYKYFPFEQNSNSVVRTAVDANGVNRPTGIGETFDGELKGHWIPGSDKPISLDGPQSSLGKPSDILSANAHFADDGNDDGNIDRIDATFLDGRKLILEYDNRNTHPYTELDIGEDATGKITDARPKFDGQPNAADFSAVGQVLGSALGRALAPNNQFVQLVAGTVVGAVGQRLAQAFVASLATDASKFDPASVFADFNVSIAGAGASSIASFLVAELGTALHVPGFSGQLFNAAFGGFTGSVASQIASKMAATPGLTFDAAISGVNFGDAAINAAYGVSALFGSFLGHELVPAQTHTGAVGGQLLGAVGSAIGITAAIANLLGSALNFLLPGVGSLIGTIIGTLIGDAFDHVPHPAAVDLIDQAGYLYGFRNYQVSPSDGGDYSIADPMARAAISIVNAYLTSVKGAALDHSKQAVVGYLTDPQPFYIDGVPGHPANGQFLKPDGAVQAAALDVLQHTEVIGGDLLMKRAHQNSTSNHQQVLPPPDITTWNGDPGATGVLTPQLASAAEQLAIMSGDLAVAQDYENYLNNREAINALMAVNPNSAFTAGWIATFARVKELGLNHVNASDFTGGLVGYLDSVSKAGLGSWASTASVSYNGVFQNAVITISIKTPNGVEVPGSLAAFADATTVSSDASGQTVQLMIGANLAAVGYHRPDAGITAGDGFNDIWFGDGSGQTFNGSGGHDILTGGAGNDTIHGGAGWDFVQGGAGNDTLSGDDGNDILRGDAGNDVLDGGAGTDTAVFGGKVGSYTLLSYGGSIGVMTHGADGSDRLQGIEHLQFRDTAIAPGAVAAFDALAYIASWPDLITAFGVNPQAGFYQYVGNGFAEGRTISFDPFEYIASNVDLITVLGLNALAGETHYIVNGYYEHRPTHSFDAFGYLASNPDLIATFGPNPLAGEKHYITNGFNEHRPTHSFDAIEYLASNPDLITAFGLNALAGEQHYVGTGYYEHRATTSFDAVEYLASNPDLIAAFGLNPLLGEQHYVGSGFYDHRATHSFDAVEYLASNPDLISAFGLNPLLGEQHYVASGFNEHRATTSFDAIEYIASNPDLITAFGLNALAGEQHYVASGFNEHRATTAFDAAQYLANYSDLAAAFGNNFGAAEQHYVASGFHEGRTDKPPVITGDGGDNTLVARNGAIMTGGGGADNFAFNAALAKPAVINDFIAGTDHLQISASGFGHGLVAGGAAALVTSATAASASHAGSDGYFIFDNAGTVWWDPNGGSGADAVALARLAGVAALHASDFLLA